MWAALTGSRSPEDHGDGGFILPPSREPYFGHPRWWRIQAHPSTRSGRFWRSFRDQAFTMYISIKQLMANQGYPDPV